MNYTDSNGFIAPDEATPYTKYMQAISLRPELQDFSQEWYKARDENRKRQYGMSGVPNYEAGAASAYGQAESRARAVADAYAKSRGVPAAQMTSGQSSAKNMALANARAMAASDALDNTKNLYGQRAKIENMQLADRNMKNYFTQLGVDRALKEHLAKTAQTNKNTAQLMNYAGNLIGAAAGNQKIGGNAGRLATSLLTGEDVDPYFDMGSIGMGGAGMPNSTQSVSFGSNMEPKQQNRMGRLSASW